MTAAGLRARINLCIVLALGINFIFWLGSSGVYARWKGVPPVPTKSGAVMMTLGDPEFSYRFFAITLQNLGDGGGRVTPLKEYAYDKLGKWFWLLHGIDPASDHVPMAAAYYFGGTVVPKDVGVVVGYLSEIGQNPVGNKWRWLAHAVFLARHRMNDLDLALDLAYKLSKMEPIGDTLPVWARQMPAFVLKEDGDRESAIKIVEELLMSSRTFHPNEVNFMQSYLVEQLGVAPEEVARIMKMRGSGEGDWSKLPKLPALMP